MATSRNQKRKTKAGGKIVSNASGGSTPVRSNRSGKSAAFRYLDTLSSMNSDPVLERRIQNLRSQYSRA